MTKPGLVSLVFIIFSSYVLPGQNRLNTVSGHVRDMETGEELIGATVYTPGTTNGTVSNTFGYYAFSLPPGVNKICYSFLGYQTNEIEIQLKKDTLIDIYLNVSNTNINEVVVKASSSATTRIGTNTLVPIQMKQIPVIGGETDVLKTIQLLPGVKSVSEGASGYSVRGGSIDQNLLLLDDAPVYNASHLMGFFSVFNIDAIQSIHLYKAYIPPKYGGRLSSVLDVRMKNGNLNKLSVNGGIGLITSRITLEGPVKPGKTSYIISARRTYADLFTPFVPNKDVKNTKSYFYDFNLKINHRFNDKNRLFLSGYFGDDIFDGAIMKLGYGNRTYTLRYNHLFTPKLFSNTSIIHSKYKYMLGTPQEDVNVHDWHSDMEDYMLKEDLTWFQNNDNKYSLGGKMVYHKFNPGTISSSADIENGKAIQLYKCNALEYDVYASGERTFYNLFKLLFGLRFTGFSNIGPSTNIVINNNYEVIGINEYERGKIFNTFQNTEPFFGVEIKFNKQSSAKFNYAHLYQYMHLASNSAAGSPLDIWLPSSPNIHPQACHHVNAGYFWNTANNKIQASVEVYYKNYDNLIDFKDHAQLYLNQNIEAEFRFGEGRAYGIEWSCNYDFKNLTGWVSYSYSRSFITIPEINSGKEYPSYYDRPHDISIVASYKLNKRISLSANWVYSSGQPSTFPSARFVYEGVVAPIYQERNSNRFPAYHRLDIGITLKQKKKRRIDGEWVFSIYNAYARKNPWSINFVQNEIDPSVTYAEKLYLYSIVPSVMYNFKF